MIDQLELEGNGRLVASYVEHDGERGDYLLGPDAVGYLTY